MTRLRSPEETASSGVAGAFDTVPGKLSKLVSGQLEGVEFFFKDPHRRRALAHALQVDEKDLEARHTAAADAQDRKSVV